MTGSIPETTDSGPLNRAEAVNWLARAGCGSRETDAVLTKTAAWDQAGKPARIGPHEVLFLHTTGRWYIESPAPDGGEHGQQTGLTKAAALTRLRKLGVSDMAAVHAIEMAPGAGDGLIVDGNLVSYADGYGWAVSPPNSPESGGLPEREEPVMEITEEELTQALSGMILSPEDISLVSPPAPVSHPARPPAGLPHLPASSLAFGGYQPGPYPVQQMVTSPRAALITGGAAVARGVFQFIRSQREEAGRWVTGALYQTVARGLDGSEFPQVYRREEGGWYSYGCHDRFPDGQFDTTGFRRLIPEGDQS